MTTMMLPGSTTEARMRSTQRFPAVKVPTEPTLEQVESCETKLADKALRDKQTVRPARRVKS